MKSTRLSINKKKCPFYKPLNITNDSHTAVCKQSNVFIYLFTVGKKKKNVY